MYRSSGIYYKVPKILELMSGPHKVVSLEEGIRIRIKTVRLRTFLKYGVTCPSCGVEGQYFVIESNTVTSCGPNWHLNLYGSGGKFNRKNVLMTSDHIWPVSKGGSDNEIKNRQPMCVKCNGKKGSTLPNEGDLNLLLSRDVKIREYVQRYRLSVAKSKEKSARRLAFERRQALVNRQRKFGIAICTETSRLGLYGKEIVLAAIAVLGSNRS